MVSLKKILNSSVAVVVSLVVFAGSIALAPLAEAANISFAGTSVSNTRPCQNATITYKAKVLDTKKKVLKDAKVTFKVYYKSTTTSYDAGKTKADGRVSKSFSIGRATPDYSVKVTSKAVKGKYTTTASTTFKPKRCS